MPFHYEQNPRLSFDSFASLCDSAEKEKQSLERRSLRELLHRGARFYDDHSFGHPGEGLQFNEEGLHSFCRLMRVPFALTTGIERAGLSTDLLNDVLGRNTIQQELGNHDLVTDTRTGLIVGVVSCSYVTYSNLISLSQAWVAQERIGFGVGVWVVHAGLAVVVAAMYWRRPTLPRLRMPSLRRSRA